MLRRQVMSAAGGEAEAQAQADFPPKIQSKNLNKKS
jgi:hypothetical protein